VAADNSLRAFEIAVRVPDILRWAFYIAVRGCNMSNSAPVQRPLGTSQHGCDARLTLGAFTLANLQTAHDTLQGHIQSVNGIDDARLPLARE
jgi:hypothetical protein